MTQIVAGPSLVVRVAPRGEAAAEPALAANVAVSVADPALSRALTDAVAAAIAGVLEASAAATEAAARAPVVRLRSRKRVARVVTRLAGAIAIVTVTERNARHLVELIDRIRAAGAAGIQLVWDGAAPPRSRVERHVFAALERARAAPSQPPVVLATSDQPVTALQILVAHRSPSPHKDPPR